MRRDSGEGRGGGQRVSVTAFATASMVGWRAAIRGSGGQWGEGGTSHGYAMHNQRAGLKIAQSCAAQDRGWRWAQESKEAGTRGGGAVVWIVGGLDIHAPAPPLGCASMRLASM
jgi:hypothetical protein